MRVTWNGRFDATPGLGSPVAMCLPRSTQAWTLRPRVDRDQGARCIAASRFLHTGALHIASYILLGGGFWLLSSAWHVPYHSQRRQSLAMVGPYPRIRHPQHLAFVLILLGFLEQWPKLLTLLMFPILLVMYGRLAVNGERDMERQFGAEDRGYAERTPRFLPRWSANAIPPSRAA